MSVSIVHDFMLLVTSSHHSHYLVHVHLCQSTWLACSHAALIHLVPCGTLVVLTALLVKAIQRAMNRRRQLLMQKRRSDSRRLAETNWTTLMLYTGPPWCLLDHPDVVDCRRCLSGCRVSSGNSFRYSHRTEHILTDVDSAILLHFEWSTWLAHTWKLEILMLCSRKRNIRGLFVDRPEHIRRESDWCWVTRDSDSVRQHVHIVQLSSQLRHLLLHESSVPHTVRRHVLSSESTACSYRRPDVISTHQWAPSELVRQRQRACQQVPVTWSPRLNELVAEPLPGGAGIVNAQTVFWRHG